VERTGEEEEEDTHVASTRTDSYIPMHVSHERPFATSDWRGKQSIRARPFVFSISFQSTWYGVGKRRGKGKNEQLARAPRIVSILYSRTE
jgi:hypothetical protein